MATTISPRGHSALTAPSLPSGHNLTEKIKDGTMTCGNNQDKMDSMASVGNAAGKQLPFGTGTNFTGPLFSLCTESAVSPRILGANMFWKLHMERECEWHPAYANNCGTCKYPQSERAQLRKDKPGIKVCRFC